MEYFPERSPLLCKNELINERGTQIIKFITRSARCHVQAPGKCGNSNRGCNLLAGNLKKYQTMYISCNHGYDDDENNAYAMYVKDEKIERAHL